jgi:hypothetical protein
MPEDSPASTAVVVPFVEVERAPATVTPAEIGPAHSIEILTPRGLRVCVPPKFDDDALRRVLAVTVR